MYSIKELIEQIERMNIKKTDTVLIHTSMKKVGEVENGADGLLTAFYQYLDEGLFLVPTHTWDFVEKEGPTLDLMEPKTCIGIIPDRAAVHPLAKRSFHMTHSMAAFGKRAEQYIQGEEKVDTPTPPEGCWGRLYQERAKILLIGVGQERNTFLHAVDEMNDTPDRLSIEKKGLTVRYPDGTIEERYSYTHWNPYCKNISQHFPKFESAFRNGGAVEDGKLGDAIVQICDAQKCADILLEILRKTERDLCIDNTPVEV